MKFDAPAIAMQIVEDLERENTRLQKLVAELLARNQQLRQALESTTRSASIVANAR